MIKNGSDELYTIFYPNPDKETVILLHGAPELLMIFLGL